MVGAHFAYASLLSTATSLELTAPYRIAEASSDST